LDFFKRQVKPEIPYYLSRLSMKKCNIFWNHWPRHATSCTPRHCTEVGTLLTYNFFARGLTSIWGNQILVHLETFAGVWRIPLKELTRNGGDSSGFQDTVPLSFHIGRGTLLISKVGQLINILVHTLVKYVHN
jgi:hypothetical protein